MNLQLSKIIILLFGLLFIQKEINATHSMGMDLTYQCLGEDTLLFTLAFYRDCEGILPAASYDVDFVSTSCGLSFTETFNQVSVQPLSAVCASLQTTCNGGTYPGVEEYIYQATVILPAKCNDWNASTSVCCRNNAINTINNPGDENIFVETVINNVDVLCNNSPVFGVKPVPFMCANKSYCFNNGAADLDGDSLVYTMITPTTGIGPGDTVTYVAGYDSQNPITSNPAFSFNPITGDFCMTPTTLGEVSVMQVLIEEYRNGVFIGSVERDIQLRVINCPNDNNLPYVDGIDGTGQFNITVCAGQETSFITNSIDVDATNNVTMNYNGGIPDATFAISGGTRPVGTFTWSPDSFDIYNNPHCFTVEVQDDNCPFTGSQVFSFCVEVTGVSSFISSTQSVECYGNCTGEATTSPSGGVPPYSYAWNDAGSQNSATATGLCSGLYQVTVTESTGCYWVNSVTLTEPPQLTAGVSGYSDVLCYGESTGNANGVGYGGTMPYSFNWSNGQGVANATGLGAGSYTLSVTDNRGCVADTTLIITEPSSSLTATSSSTLVFCRGGSSGTSAISASGGSSPYSYLWETGVTSVNLTGVVAGTYDYSVTDTNGCLFEETATVSEPASVLALGSASNSAGCFGSSDGSITVTASGGISPYTYQWEANAGGGTSPDVYGLSNGSYTVTVMDNNGCQKEASIAVGQPIQLNVSVTKNDATCGNSNGSMTVNPSGGTLPYTILWGTGQTDFSVTGLASAVYSVTVTDDNGCQLDTFGIVNDIILSASIVTTTDLDCYRENIGTATVEASGGLTPYAYNWSDGQSTPTAVSLYAGYYLVTTTDDNNCKVFLIANIYEPPQIEIQTDTIEVSCNGLSDGVLISNATGGVSGYNFQWDASAGSAVTQNVSGLPAGFYSLSVTDGNGCLRDTVYELTEPESVTLSTTVGNVSCYQGNDGSATVTAGGGISPYSYLWDSNASNQNTSIANSLVAGSYAVSVTDANGCLAQSDVTITQPTQIASDTSFTNVSCNGGSDGTVGITAFQGTSPYTYLWSNGETVSTVTGISAGNYVVTILDNNNCSSTNSVVVTEPNLLSYTSTVSEVSCYFGSDGTAGVAISGGVTPYSYLWTTNTGNPTSSSVSNLNYGTHTFTVTDFNNCNLDGSVFIDRPDTFLYVQYTEEHVLCYGESTGSIDLIGKGGTPFYLYSWSNGANTRSLTGLSVGTYSLTLTDSHGCILDNVTIDITQPDEIVITTDSIPVVCFGESNGSAELIIAGGVTPYTYLWTNGESTSSISDQFAGNYSVSVTDAYSCNFDTNIVITQPDLLEILTTITNTSCNAGDDGVANAIGIGGTTPYNYQWGAGAAFQNGTQATALAKGTYDLTLTDTNGCIAVSTITVGEPSAITITTTPPADTICPGGTSLIGALATGGNGNYTYTWNNGLGVGQTKSVIIFETTRYKVWVEDQNGCGSDSAEVIVNVIDHYLDSLSITYDQNICEGLSTTIHSSYFEEFPPYTYTWNNGLGSSIGDFTVSPSETTTYVLTVTNSCGNSIQDSVTITVYPLPEVEIGLNASNGCDPLLISFENLLDNADIIDYDWNFGDGFSSSLPTPGHLYDEEGVYQVSLEVTSSDGCTNNPIATAVNVTVNPTPVASIKLSPQTTSTDAPEITFLSTSTGGTNFVWSFGDGDSSAVENIEHTYADTGRYNITLIVSNDFGCADTAYDVVIITPVFTFDAPTAFIPDPTGPNGGKYDKNNMRNDVFVPITEFVEDFHLTIFNRWGEIVFETFDINIGWDGYYRDELCQQDVYIWKAKMTYIDGSQQEKVGQILLIR